MDVAANDADADMLQGGFEDEAVPAASNLQSRAGQRSSPFRWLSFQDPYFTLLTSHNVVSSASRMSAFFIISCCDCSYRGAQSFRAVEVEDRAEPSSQGSEEEQEEEKDTGNGDAFNGLGHVKKYSRIATKALDKVEAAARKGAHRRRGSSGALNRCAPL